MRLIDGDELIEKYSGGGFYTAAHVRVSIAATPTAYKWRKAEEPPKENGRYLVSWEGAVTTDEYKNGVWLCASMFSLRVTHWMPLPKPPKEDNV